MDKHKAMLKIFLPWTRACLFISVVFSVMIYQPAWAHGGVDHNNNCFLNVGDSKFRLSGYQFHPELEGKHFCHFFPELGQLVLAVEPWKEGSDKAMVTLELAKFSGWLNLSQAFTVIKQQPEQLVETGLISISATIQQRGVYRLKLMLQPESGATQQQYLWFLVGIPVTKILVIISGLLILLFVFFGVSGYKKQC
jgi:hypothetical protein